MGVLAKQPHRGVKMESIEDFSGGLNTLLAPNKIAENEAAACLNVWHETGALKKRRGYTTSSITVDGGALTSLSDPYLAVIAQTYYYLISGIWGGGTRGIFSSSSPTGTFTPVAYNTGTVTTNSASTAVTGIGTNWLANGLQVKSGQTNMQFRIAGNNTTQNITAINSDTSLTLGANAPATVTGSAYYIFQPVADTVAYGVQGANIYIATQNLSVWQWVPGGNISQISGSPKASNLLSFLNYLFAGPAGANGASINANQLIWSALSAPTSWPSANFLTVSKDTGDTLVGMFSDDFGVVILKTRSAWKLNGSVFDPSNPSYSLTRIPCPTSVQFTGIRTVQRYMGHWIMFGGDGLYVYDGASIRRLGVSDRIGSEWANSLQSGASGYLAQTNINDGAVWNNRYWVQIWDSISGANQFIGYVLDQKASLWKWTSSDNNLFGPTVVYSNTSNNTLELYGIDGNNVLKLDTGSSDGASAINGTWTSKVFDYKGQQSFGRLWVDIKKQSVGNLTVEYSIDEGAFTSSTVDMTAGTGTRVKSQEIMIGQVGQSIQFRLSNNVAAQDFEVYGLAWERKPLRN